MGNWSELTSCCTARDCAAGGEGVRAYHSPVTAGRASSVPHACHPPVRAAAPHTRPDGARTPAPLTSARPPTLAVLILAGCLPAAVARSPPRRPLCRSLPSPGRAAQLPPPPPHSRRARCTSITGAATPRLARSCFPNLPLVTDGSMSLSIRLV